MTKPLTILAIVALLGSCKSEPHIVPASVASDSIVSPVIKTSLGYDGDIKIIEIDSCQYIQTYRGGVCHKGNCKNPIHWKVITR